MRVIAGSARGKPLRTLPGADTTRPTLGRVKEAMFSSVQFLLPGARVLDLFAGSGQLGIEALSRGAAHATFVDASRQAAAVVRANCEACGLLARADIVTGDAFAFVQRRQERYDLVLLDPPFRGGTLPRLLPLLAPLVAPGGVVLAESENGAAMPETAGTLTRSRQYGYGTILVTRYERAL